MGDPMHQDKEVGKKIKKSVEEITAKLEKRLENPDTANMASALMEAASKQCRKENKKAYGETAENGPKTLEVLFLKRWLNQGVDDQDDEECLSGEKGQQEKDKNSVEDAEDAEEESNGGLRGSSEVGF